MEIIPAIMPESSQALTSAVEQVLGEVHAVQVDVMDGEYVPEISWPYTADTEETAALDAGDVGLPAWDKLDIEADLMVADGLTAARQWLQWGAARIVLHYEALSNPAQTLTELSGWRGQVGDGHEVGTAEIGIALGVDTPTSALDPILSSVDFVQFMGIANIGYQGQQFEPSVLEHIHDLHRSQPNVVIQVDGGVDHDNAADIVSAGASRLVSGSAIWEHESDDPMTAVVALRDAAAQ